MKNYNSDGGIISKVSKHVPPGASAHPFTVFGIFILYGSCFFVCGILLKTVYFEDDYPGGDFVNTCLLNLEIIPL